MPEKAYASLLEEFEAFWKEVKEGGKHGDYEHFKLDEVLGARNDQDWNLGIRIDGIERDIFRQAKEFIIDGIMENGPYTKYGSRIVGPVTNLISNTVHLRASLTGQCPDPRQVSLYSKIRAPAAPSVRPVIAPKLISTPITPPAEN